MTMDRPGARPPRQWRQNLRITTIIVASVLIWALLGSIVLHAWLLPG